MEGLTGKIAFDQSGLRTDFQLDIIELTKDGLDKVGTWNREQGTNFTRNFTQMYTNLIESLHNTTLVVTTILSEPYTMYKENKEVLTGNDQFEGHNIDLIDAIAKILGFNYTIRLVEDGKYGSIDKKSGQWNGMIGELLSQKADLAIADLTITYEREQGVDFTMPFMNLGITILILIYPTFPIALKFQVSRFCTQSRRQSLRIFSHFSRLCHFGFGFTS